MESQDKIVIVGAGLAGLTCARELHRRGRPFLLLEAADAVGGRIRTDVVDGFRLDRGFQVLLTAYPAARALFDYEKLRLRPYQNGALIRRNGRFHRFVDPWRHPLEGIKSAFGPVGSLFDKLRVAKLRARSRSGAYSDIFRQQETATADCLKAYGFSAGMIDAFFRPFLGGVFLERDLQTSSRVLHFVFRMFSEGDISVPALGMEELPKQIAADIPDEQIHCATKVTNITPSSVQLESGETINASHVVLATGRLVADRLLGSDNSPQSRRVRCLYFAAERPPMNDPILVLNGDGNGPVNNLSVPSLVAPEYAPSGQHLISASVVDGDFVERNDLTSLVTKQCAEWFGDEIVSGWRPLADYDIKHALPDQLAGSDTTSGRAVSRDGVIVCGDHVGNASIQSALESGLDAAELCAASPLVARA